MLVPNSIIQFLSLGFVSRQLIRPNDSAEMLAELLVDNSVALFPPASLCERSSATCELQSDVSKLRMDKAGDEIVFSLPSFETCPAPG